MPGSVLARRKARGSVARACLALVTTATAVAVALPSGASAEVPPYSLPVTLPAPKQSPAVDANAPYTPVVLDLIHQLEPSNPPTRDRARQREQAAARRAERRPATTSGR